MRIFAMMLCALTTTTFSAPTTAYAATAAPAPAERFAHISVTSTGAGKALVLIPGLSTPREVWAGVAPELARSHRVLLVQVNGFAGDPPGANLQPDVLGGVIEDLHTLIAREKLGQVRLVGHSLGGLVAMQMAARHTDDVASVMVVDALPFAGVMFDEHATVEAVRPLAAMLKTKLSAGYAGPDGPAAAAATAKGLTAKPESAAKVEQWVRAANPEVAAEAMAEDLTTDLRGDLASLQAPITLVHPTRAFGKDQAATDAFYRAQFAGAKHVTFVAIPDSGHFIMLDQPERFRAALLDFAK